MYVKKYHQYNLEGGSFYPIGQLNLAASIKPGYYSCNRSMSGIYLEPVDVVLDGLIKFNDSLANELMDNIKKFWEAKPKFDKIKQSIKLLYKRGFLLYGPPGCGKSSILSIVVKDIVDGGGVAIMFNGVDLTTDCIKAIRDIDPDKRIVVILEDLDNWARRDEEGILNMLDGVDTTFENLIYLGTTNHVDRISKRVLRPSRFDFKIGMDYPTLETRRQYLTSLFDSMKFSNPEVVRNVIEKMTNDTDKFSFADLKEFFISVALFGYEYDKVLSDIQNALHTEDIVRASRTKNTLTKTADTKPTEEEECSECGELKENCECEPEPKD